MSCRLKYFTAQKREGRTEVVGGQRRRRMQLLDDLTENRSLNEEALYPIMYKKCFEKCYGSAVREREVEEFVIN
jgi:hypothetical protein